MIKHYGIISDTHHHQWSAFSTALYNGVNSRLQATLDETARCAAEVLEAGGDTIIHGGDLFHVRGSIAPSVLNPTMDLYRDLIDNKDMKIVILAGNHDLEGKDAARVSSAITALEGVGCQIVSDAGKPLFFEGKWLVPWHQNIAELKAVIEAIPPEHKSAYDLVIHAPIDEVIVGIPSHGLDAKYLASLGFGRVFSGHYHHHKQFEGGVYSIGALTHHSWSDVGSKAGFLIVGDDVKWRASRAPSFVEITAETDPDDIALIVDGNYVRAKINTSKSADVEDTRQFLLDSGAKGVIIIVEKDTTVSKRTDGTVIKSGATLDQSVNDYINAQKFANPKDLGVLCDSILKEARGE